MAVFSNQIKFGSSDARCLTMAMCCSNVVKQWLFSRTTRVIILTALVLSLIATYATDIWNVEVRQDLFGKPGPRSRQNALHITMPPLVSMPRPAHHPAENRSGNYQDVSSYDWDEDKLRADAASASDKNESFAFLDDILDKFNKTSTKRAKPSRKRPTTNQNKKTSRKPHNADSDLQSIVPIIPSFVSEDTNCANLFANDENEMAGAGKYQRGFNKVIVPDYHYITATKKCDKFKQSRQYVTEPLSAEEAEFPLAFSILIFKDVEQFERLLRAIYRPQNYYCVHVDVKSADDVKRAAKGLAGCFDNVFISSQSYDVTWGAYSVLQPELTCMEELWKYKKWKYFINLTGQEFPLQSMWDIVKVLKVYNGANNMEGTVERRNKDRTVYVHNGYYPTEEKKGPCPVNVTISKGSVHITASRAYVDFVLHDEQAIQFREWVKDTGVPDETFFSSLNFSPQLGVPGAYKGTPETDTEKNLFITRFKNWGTYPFEWPCAGQRVRMVCIHGIGDLPQLADRKELFTNKFYLDYHPLALDCMEELVLNRTRDEVLGRRKFDTSFYKELDFVKNHV